jgi:glycolate oxidase
MNTEELVALLSPDRVLTKDEDVIPYAFDGTAAIFNRPLAVVFPQTAEEVSAVLRWANAHKIPVATRGSGTGLAGGSVAHDGGIVLCLVKFNQIIELDRDNLCLLTQPGVLTAEVSRRAEEAGLFYPPDPSSMKISTIGGNVANNSGGLRGLKYGVTRDYVMGIEVVLANGDIVWLGSKCVKDVAGLSLKDMFIGSEGVLGVITKILLKLVPKPASRRTLLATYDSLEKAARAVSSIIAYPVIPCTLEFLDKITLRAVEDFAKVGLPQDAEALVLMETDGHPAQVAEEAEAMARIAKEAGAQDVKTAASEAEGAALATARRSAFSALARIRPTTILEDVTVPRSELPALVRAIQSAAEKHSVRVGVFGHFGDGNVHPTFLTDERDTEEMHRVELAMREVMEATVRLGGTITGEHGVGLAKKQFLPIQFGEADMRLLATIKAALDPNRILNPGKIFDEPQAAGEKAADS